jgi:retinol dehydrogenase 12
LFYFSPSRKTMTFGLVQWARDQFVDLPLVTENLEGRIVIVTGSNTGLGFDCAKHFLQMKPAKLILAVRSTEKGQAAALRMIEETKETRPDIVEVWKLDMASLASVQEFAQRVETLPRLDIAVLNSGVAAKVWETTGDGYELS